ncbi:MAG: DUF883 family protein [Caulobacteraceae bacterium]|nr:DUF883 family protein [Caulobacteraceae bacterium]
MPTHPFAGEAGDRVKEALSETERALQETVQQAEHVIQERLEKLRAQSRLYAEEAERSFETAQKYLTERVHERPVATTAIALGVGVLVGLLIGGRRR